jgi:hypothetical protein
MFQLAKHDHAKFQLSNFHPDGLRPIFDLFSKKKIKIGSQKNSKVFNSEKIQKLKGIFYQNLSHLAFYKYFKNDFIIF